VLVCLFAAYICLVRLYDLVLSAERAGELTFAQSLADAVAHEPSGLVIDFEGPVHLVRREAFFRSRHQSEPEKPFVSRDVAALKDRADPHSELAPAWRAVRGGRDGVPRPGDIAGDGRNRVARLASALPSTPLAVRSGRRSTEQLARIAILTVFLARTY